MLVVSFKDEEFEELYNRFSGEISGEISGEKGLLLKETKEIGGDDNFDLTEMDEKDILLITVPEKKLPSLINQLAKVAKEEVL
jgi:hypothetical protein